MDATFLTVDGRHLSLEDLLLDPANRLHEASSGRSSTIAELQADPNAVVYDFSTGRVVLWSAAAPPGLPVNTVRPVITGQTKAGETLTATTGTWTGAQPITYTIQWRRNGVNIGLATGPTYVCVNGDAGSYISVVVQATNSVDTDFATSDSVGPVVSLPVPVNAPIASGSPAVGSTLSTTDGVWAGSPYPPSISYQWQRGMTAISGATASTYLCVAADAGTNISCVVTGTNSIGSTTQTSNAIGPITVAPANTALPVISGSATVGGTLSCTSGTWTAQPGATFAYQWIRAGTDIPGATSNTYVPVELDAGTILTCRVTATNTLGSASATSTGSTLITMAPINVVLPAISGTTTVGQVLTVSQGNWGGYPIPTYTHQWKRDGVAIDGATSDLYTLVAADQGTTLTVDVTGTNLVGNLTVTTAPTDTIS
jgi:hypothetical protein